MNEADNNQRHASEGKPQIALHIVILLLAAAIVIASLLFQRDDGRLYLFGFRWPHHCPLYETVGVKCALCGLTRSFCLLAHGNLLQALKFHTLGPAIFAFICFQIPYRIYSVAIRPKNVSRKLKKINLSLTMILLAAIFVNWLIYLGGLIL